MNEYKRQQKQAKKNRKAKIRQAEARHRRAAEKKANLGHGLNVGTMSGFMSLVQARRAAVVAPWALLADAHKAVRKAA